MKYFSFLLFSFFMFTTGSAQDLDQELGFIYVKADYLLDTDRYEESILEFSKIIERDPAFKDALYKRATAKYAIGAFKGVKLDLLKSIEFTGINAETILLYGKALELLGETESASKTLKIASVFYPDDNKASKHKDTSGTKNDPNDKNSDVHTEEVIKEEVKKLEDKISSILEDLLPESENSTEEKDGQEKESDPGYGEESNQEDKSTSNQSDEAPSKVKVYIPDNSVNEIYIDEDLTLEIRDGLGNRNILQQPNILILSESAGDVAVDLCVNRNGKVISAEYNQDKSDLNIQSLISLAVRKSKEFWFAKSDRANTCGTIIFRISGRN